MFSKAFWADALERAIKTVAQTSVALLTADGVIGLFDIAWEDVASVSGLAGLVALLTAIGAAKLSPKGTAQILVNTYDYDV